MFPIDELERLELDKLALDSICGPKAPLDLALRFADEAFQRILDGKFRSQDYVKCRLVLQKFKLNSSPDISRRSI